MTNYLVIEDKALQYLINTDSILGNYINKVGKITNRVVTKNPFESLYSSIISQQVSLAAAKSIKQKFLNLVGKNPTPEHILSFSDEELRNCGLSRPKIKYIKSLSSCLLDGSISFEGINKLTDDEVIKMLTLVKGIGVWTAEMFLIFCLERPNVLSYLDLGIRRGIKNLYQLDDLPTKEFADELFERFSPYNTVASLYLWEASK